MRREHALMAVAAFVLAGSAAAQSYVTGYAVSNHRPCAASNLPGTIPELRKFFESPDFPADFAKNELWTEARVRVAEWVATGDHFSNDETASGFDGVDAPLISYIASHGVTRAAKYTAYAGGGAAGCSIDSNQMAIGDQDARYLILSTCQGVKIGNGDNPTAAGEDPRRTWNASNQGLNCILGYSNNMADDDKYGVYLLNLLKTTDLSLTAAFYRASRQVSYGNVPAVLCFGPDDGAARAQLDEARGFTTERFGHGGSAYSYERPRPLTGAVLEARAKATPRQLVVAPRRLARATLEAELGGKLTVDDKTGVATWQRSTPAPHVENRLDDAKLVARARAFAERHGLAQAGETWTPTYVLERGMSFEKGPIVVEKTVVFHQVFGGLASLGARGSLEVRIDADGEVTGFIAAAVDAWPVDGADLLAVDPTRLAAGRAVALERLAAAHPEATLTVVDERLGYDTRAPLGGEPVVQAVAEVTVEVAQGGVARRFVERTPL